MCCTYCAGAVEHRLPREAGREMDAGSLHVAARGAQEVERARDGRGTRCRCPGARGPGVALDDLEPLRAQDFGERDVALDVGDRHGRALGAGGAARFASAAGLRGPAAAGSVMGVVLGSVLDGVGPTSRPRAQPFEGPK